MHPCPTANETHTLAPDLNRGMTAGMDRVDINAHLESATENSTASPYSQRTVNTLTSDGHETPPENPATELNTTSTPNTRIKVMTNMIRDVSSLIDNLAMNRIPCYVIPLSLVQTS